MALREGWIEKPIDGAQENIDIQSGTLSAQRRFYGPWVDRYVFLADYLPTITFGQGGSAGAQRRFYPDIPHLLAYKADIIGKLVPSNTGASESIAYEKCEIVVYYEANPNTFFITSGIRGGAPSSNPDGQTNYPLSRTYSWEYVTELKRIKGENIKDKEGQKQHDKGDVEIPIKMMNFRVTYHDAVYPGVNDAANSAGKINKDTILFNDLAGVFPVFPARTLRYDGSSGTSKVVLSNLADFSISNTFEVTHNFVYNTLGWHRNPIGIEPVEIGQDDVTPVKYIFSNVSIYLIAENSFGDFLQNAQIFAEGA